MIKDLWRWLTRANARHVLYYSVACMVVVNAWWLWREVAPHRSTGMLFGTPVPMKQTPIRAAAFIGEQLSISDGFVGDPFVFKRSRQGNSSAFRPTQRPESRWPSWRVAESNENSQTAFQPPERASIGLAFEGMWVLTDDKVGARIMNRTAKTTSFYSPGDMIGWLKIGKVDYEQVEIVSPDGSVTYLKRGSPIVFEESDSGE